MGLRYYHPIYNNYFSVDEEEWLLQNYKKGAAFCKKHLNRPYNSMWRILKKHNLSFPSKKIFTDEIVNLLMGDKTDKEISAITGIDEIKIRNKRIALGKSKVKYHRNKWTQVEDDILKEVFPKEGGKCCFRFDNKTEEEVRRRAKCLGIKRDKTSRYNGMCKTILCVEKNITFTSVKDAAIFAGISRNNISAAVNQKNKTAGGYHWEFVDEEKELIERSMQTKTVKKICDLIKKHTLQTSVDSREDRDLLCQKLFRLMEKFKKEDNSVFLSHLFDGDLYCYTTLSFSALKRINKRDSVYLCCSKEIDSFNPMCRCFDPYKFFYRFQTKKGSINIDANSFLKEHQRQHENEVIVALSDIVQVDELRMFREFGKTKISGYHWKQSDEEKQG